VSGLRVAVIGGGIIGLAVARELLQVVADAEVTVIEKEPRVGEHQTGHNSGVVHAGVYYAPGSLKARLCRRGVELLRAYCSERSLPYEECGKVIVARNDEEVVKLEELLRRSLHNGVPGIRRLNVSELQELEPHVTGVAALHSPTTAITDFRAVTAALAGDAVKAGASLWLGVQAVRLQVVGARARVQTVDDVLEFDRVIVCAGLYADRLARSAGDAKAPMIVPFRGEYLRLAPDREGLVAGLVYPVPDPRYPFLGVHFTRRVGGGVDVGPNALLALAREGYRRSDVSRRDVTEALGFRGFHRLVARHWMTGVREGVAAAVRRVYLARARSFIPELGYSDLIPAQAGVRAQAVDADGKLVDDFRISQLGPITAVRNAPSPGATASLAIAEHIVARAFAG
jgi:L-2-hydroxyglutarate oxidase LhgO